MRSYLMSCASALAIALLSQGSALAQTAASPPGNADDGAELETLVVTARQRQESIQSTPVAVTAVSEAGLQRLFVRDLADLSHMAPNFTIEGVGSIHRNSAVVFARGIGYQGVDMGQDPAVGVSVNGVFYSRNIGALSNFLDVDHVEMLRGPQGTLFGKNTVGGVVNVTTKKPGDEFGGAGSIRYGNYGRIDSFLAVDMPLGDQLAARISYQSQNSDGVHRNSVPQPIGVTIPRRLGDDDIKTIRGTLVWRPTEEFSVDFVASYLKDRSGSTGGVNGSVPTDLVYRLGFPGFGYPGGPTDPYLTARDFPSGDYQDSVAMSLNTRYHAQGFDIIGVTGWARDSNFSYNDYDDSQLHVFESEYTLHNKQFSQEIRLESTGTSKFKWVAGVFGSTRRWEQLQVYFLPIVAPTAPIQEDLTTSKPTSIAAFAQAQYEVAPGLTVEFGVRATRDKKDIFRVLQHPITVAAPPPVTDSHVWKNVNYRANVSYQINPDMLTYATVSTGYIAGGYNSRANLAAAIGPFAPIKARAFEAGYKADWLDRRLRTNVALFWNQYNNLQTNVFQRVAGGSSEQQIVANNANERARGFEVEVTAIPVEHMLVNLSAGYLDAKYTSFLANLKGAGNPVTDNTFLRPIRTPKWTGRLEVSYEVQLPNGAMLMPVASYSYEGSHFTDLLNVQQGYQKAYSLVNASLTYKEPKERWRLSAWGKNLGNVAHRLSAISTAGLATQLYFATPRTYGLDLTVNF